MDRVQQLIYQWGSTYHRCISNCWGICYRPAHLYEQQPKQQQLRKLHYRHTPTASDRYPRNAVDG